MLCIYNFLVYAGITSHNDYSQLPWRRRFAALFLFPLFRRNTV